jgi:CO/xanthine dehydrogenase FAD-binding subunit
MQYQAPASIDEAVSLLAQADGGRVLAGGTDLLVQMGAGFVKPGLIVDIKNIPEANGISDDGGAFRFGAAVPGAVMNEHDALKAAWPGVVEAVDLIGSTQIQGRATAAGNLCNASPAADSVPAMVAVGATATIAGPNGQREVPVEEIPTGPGQTSLGKGEFVVDIRLPAQSGKTGSAYLRMIPRTEMDIAIVVAGVCLTLDDSGTITSARLALGAVAPTVVQVPDAAAALVGSQGDDAAMAAVAAAASAACNPIDDKRGTIDYRVKVAGVLAKRATAIALDRARSN